MTIKYFCISASILLLLCACQPSPAKLKKTFIRPTNGYSQAVIVESNGVKTIYVAGQVSEAEGFENQVREVFGQLDDVLQEAGASLKDVVQMNTYIVNYSAEMLPIFRSIRKEILGESELPANTLVGVTSLARPEYIIEIEAIAVISNN